jgi:hypothetical protein
MKNAATPAAANHPQVGIDERSKPPITVEEDAAPPEVCKVAGTVGSTGVGMVAFCKADDGAADTVNEKDPDGMPPTDHDSFHAPISWVRAVPAIEKLPDESVVPIGVVLPAAVTVTCLFGEAPEIDTSHVSPT